MGRTDKEAPTAVRRSDKAVADEGWIRAFLRSGAYGVMATADDGQPFINTNLYVFDEARHCLYLHTARTGRTRRNIEAEERVCFAVSEMGRILPDEIALEFSLEYAGVTIFGLAQVVQDEAEKARALQLLMDKYAPHLRPDRDYRPPNVGELARTSVFRIDIRSWSAKRNQKPADFPGAYRFESHRERSPFVPGGGD